MAISEEEREAICINCGLCCYASVDIVGVGHVLLLKHPCPYMFRVESGESRCDIYSDRHSVQWCRDLPSAIDTGSLPVECPYVSGIDNYDGKRVIAGYSNRDLGIFR